MTQQPSTWYAPTPGTRAHAHRATVRTIFWGGLGISLLLAADASTHPTIRALLGL